MNPDKNTLIEYCIEHSSEVDQLLIELERETNLKTLAPQMLSGRLLGSLITMISKMLRPKKVLEIGTFTGYSAICLAQGLKAGGNVTTLEINEELSFISNSYFKKAGLENAIIPIIGDALEIIPTLEGPYDIIFIDAAKKDYLNYFDLVIDKVESGGVILADNVLWSGKVLDKIKDATTQVLDDFNRKILADKRVEVVMLPLRDGLSIIRKI